MPHVTCPRVLEFVLVESDITHMARSLVGLLALLPVHVDEDPEMDVDTQSQDTRVDSSRVSKSVLKALRFHPVFTPFYSK